MLMQFQQKITNKILHSPFTKIKEDIAYDDFNLKLIQELFDLEPKTKRYSK